MDRAGRGPLHYAALSNDVVAVRTLIATGEALDARDGQGFTPLHFAAQEGSVDAARALLNAGAEVDAENIFGNTPLFVAVFNSRGSGSLIQLLREGGADPFHVNKSGQTPAGLARLIGNFDVARFFADLREE